MFGTTNIAHKSGKSNYVYCRYGKVFHGASSCSFGNYHARNVIIFGVDNSSSFHTDNHKNNSLVLGKGPSNNVSNSGGTTQKKFSI